MIRADKVDGGRSQKPWSRPPSHSSRHPTTISGGGVARMDLDLVVVPCLSQRQTMSCIPLSAACARNKKREGWEGETETKNGFDNLVSNFEDEKNNRRLSKRRTPESKWIGSCEDGMMGSTATGPSPAKMTQLRIAEWSRATTTTTPPRQRRMHPGPQPIFAKEARTDRRESGIWTSPVISWHHMLPPSPGPPSSVNMCIGDARSHSPILLSRRPRHPFSLLIQYLYLFEYLSALSVNTLIRCTSSPSHSLCYLRPYFHLFCQKRPVSFRLK